jgi:hypothetical protein
MASIPGIALDQTVRLSRALIFALMVFAFLTLPSSGRAQVVDDISQTAPPPPKLLSKEEKEQLSAVFETKKVTKLALELMEIRMKKAEEADARDDFQAMFTELGGFHALMDYTLNFLLNRHEKGKKAFNDFKKYEIGLRTFTSRIELIRRDLPIKYEFYVRTLFKYLRETRAKAIDPLFGDSVVRDKENPD